MTVHTRITITTIVHTTIITDIITAGMTNVIIMTTEHPGVRMIITEILRAMSIMTPTAAHIITIATTDAGITTTTITATGRRITITITTTTIQTTGAVVPTIRIKDIITAGTIAVITMTTAM